MLKAKLKNEVGSVRAFNRYYTNILGLLDRHILGGPFSLSEVRVLHEIAKTENCTARVLSETLVAGPRYLSRILTSFQKSGLIEKCRSPADGRAQYLTLSPAGRSEIDALDAKSDEQIAGILSPLPEEQREELVRCMKRIEQILEVKNHAG